MRDRRRTKTGAKMPPNLGADAMSVLRTLVCIRQAYISLFYIAREPSAQISMKTIQNDAIHPDESLSQTSVIVASKFSL